MGNPEVTAGSVQRTLFSSPCRIVGISDSDLRRADQDPKTPGLTRSPLYGQMGLTAFVDTSRHFGANQFSMSDFAIRQQLRTC